MRRKNRVATRRKVQYRPGEILLYNEGGLYYLVKCVKNESDSEWIRYTLQIVEILKANPLSSGILAAGTNFKVTERADIGGHGPGWYLRDPEEELKLISRLRGGGS